MRARPTPPRTDPLESAIESALSPGAFIGWNASSSFVSQLEDVADSIDRATAKDAARAVRLYETLAASTPA